jgi:hypothetical protein
MVRDDRHKIVVLHDWWQNGSQPEGELYDLLNDPEELTNLWDHPEYSSVRSNLYARVIEALVAAENRSSVRAAPW